MKRILSIFLSVMLVMSVAACGRTDTNSSSSEPTETISITEERESTVESESATEPEESAETEESIEAEAGSENEESTVAVAEEETENGTNILIAYFSWSGNTEQVAQEIQSQTGGDLFELILTDPYPEDYNETGERWHRERDEDARPELAVEVENLEDYDIVFLGYPIWSSTLPSPNRTFLDSYDFSGKTIIPFCTHGGSRFGSSVSVIEELAPGATIEEGYETSGNSASNCAEGVAQWLRGLGMIE